MIAKNMTILDIIVKYPQTQSVFEKYGMACSGCMAAMDETLESGAKMHGIEIEKLLQELNTVLQK